MQINATVIYLLDSDIYEINIDEDANRDANRPANQTQIDSVPTCKHIRRKEAKEHKENKEEQQLAAADEKVISILEGWDFERDLRPLSLTIVKQVSSENHSIHYQTITQQNVNLSDEEFIKFVVAYAAACKFSDANLEQFREKYSIERVFLGIYQLQGRKDIRSPVGYLMTICEESDFQNIQNQKTKKRRLKTTNPRSSDEPNFRDESPPINPKRVHRFTTMDKVSGTG
jgi:hypothetical protein